MIATTLNIHVDILSKIEAAAERFKKSKRAIIVMLLKRLMLDYKLQKLAFSTVKYQDDDMEENWHCFHIRFREDENEYFVDMRKVCKLSVSHLLAIAVRRFLYRITRKREREFVANYPFFVNYVMGRRVIDGIISYHFYWGFPYEYIKNKL